MNRWIVGWCSLCYLQLLAAFGMTMHVGLHYSDGPWLFVSCIGLKWIGCAFLRAYDEMQSLSSRRRRK